MGLFQHGNPMSSKWEKIQTETDSLMQNEDTNNCNEKRKRKRDKSCPTIQKTYQRHKNIHITKRICIISTCVT